MTAIPTIDTLVLPGSVGSTFGQLSGWSGASSTFVSDASGSGSRRMTDPTGVAYELVWQDAWASAYVLLTCTREDEILVPIESQLASISHASAAVFAKSLAICAACLVVIVAASVVLSFLMARPVVQTLAQSDKIVANIGGDLFKSVKITGRRRDEKPSWKDGSSPLAGLVQLPGEVAALRGEFVKALFELGKKRVRTVAPASPLYQSGLPPSAPTIPTSNLPGPYAQCVGQIHQPEDAKRQSQALDLEMEAPVSQPLTLWNSIVAKITIYLLLPTVVAMVVVVAITFGTVFQDVESWMSPVRDTMVAEELLSLDVRAYERSQLASAFIGTAAGSLQVLHGFATELVDGELPHGEARTTYVSPWWPGPGPCPSLTGPPSRLFECSTAPPKYGAPVSYKPRGVLPPSVKMVDPAAVSVAPGDNSTAVDLDSVADPWVREQLLLSQLDLPFSYALFASNIMDAYYGGHVSEAYKQFPYSRLESYYDPSYATGAKKCDAFPSTQINSYTPVCRPWYQNAIRQPGVVYNRVLNDATNPGQMFLGLSTALRMSNGSSLVGVLGVSVGLEELANDVGAFPTGDMQRLEATKGSDLYLRGYAFMWDEEGFAIVHKNYKKPANQGQGALLVADLDAGSDAVFRSAFQTNVVEQGRVRGVWEFPWFNPDKGRNEIWHYLYMPLNNTPYMIALTVVADEVTAGPDAAQDRIEDSLRNGMWLSLAIIAVLLLLLVGFTVWLYLRFALPLRRLLRIVKKWGRRDYKGDISDSDAHNAANRELAALMLNFQKMLVALRFGETSWADGSWVSVLRNNLAALDLVEAGGNHRSLGAVMNNVALSAADASVQEAYPSLQVGEIYGAAISAVKEQMAAEQGNPALVDTLAFRLLNCTLWHLKAKPPRPAEAKAGLDEMLQYCTSPRTMATVAQRVSAEVLASGRIPAVQPVAHRHRVPVQPPDPAHADLEIVGAVALLIEKALAFCASSPLAHDDSDPRSGIRILVFQSALERTHDSDLLADLALAHCDIGCMSGSCEPPQLALWALVSLPIIGESTRTRLSLHAKAGCGPDFARFIDAACGLEEDGNFSGPVSKAKGAATARWRAASEQAGLPKVMLVALDLSHSMHGARLSTCQTSLKTILTKNMEDRDRVALVSFADDVRTEFGLTVAGPAGGTARQSMFSTVDLLGTRGGTAFYDACVVGALTLHQQLAGEPATPKWLVALTDGEDNRSRPDSARRCIGLLKSTPNLNLALITVGAINMSVCQQFLDATTEAGNKALLVQAKNQTEISKAFASVAAAMDAGVAEVL